MSTKSDYYDWRRLPLSLKLQLAEKRIVELESSLAAVQPQIDDISIICAEIATKREQLQGLLSGVLLCGVNLPFTQFKKAEERN